MKHTPHSHHPLAHPDDLALAYRRVGGNPEGTHRDRLLDTPNSVFLFRSQKGWDRD